MLYPTEVDRVRDVFGQLTQPIFRRIDSWVRANENTLTMKELSHKIEYYMGIHMLAATAKKDVNIVVIKSGEPVNEYYYRIFNLLGECKNSRG